MSVEKLDSELRQQSGTGKKSVLERLEFTLNVINQMCIGFVTIYMSWLCLRDGLHTMHLHAWLVTLGFSLLMAEGVMCHYSGNVLTFNYRRSTKTTIHWVLLLLGGGCGVAGGLIMLIPIKFRFDQIHGILGFTAWLLCLISMLTGLCALCSYRIKRIISPLLNKTFHNILGLATFVIALVAQFYGYYFFGYQVQADMLVLLRYVTLISLVLTSIGPLKALYQKFTNICAAD